MTFVQIIRNYFDAILKITNLGIPTFNRVLIIAIFDRNLRCARQYKRPASVMNKIPTSNVCLPGIYLVPFSRYKINISRRNLFENYTFDEIREMVARDCGFI